MNIKELEGAKDEGVFWALVSNIFIYLYIGTIGGGTFMHDQKPTAEILLRSEALGSVLN